MKQYFATCTTIEDVKQLFRQLAIANHPDKGGCEETMKEINSQYEHVIKKMLLSGKNPQTGFSFTESEINDQINLSEKYQEVINAIAGLEGVVIELVGNWIWVTGATFQHKEALKAAGFMWASKKKAWYFRSEEYKCKRGHHLDLDQIKAKYGSVKLEGKTQHKIGK